MMEHIKFPGTSHQQPTVGTAGLSTQIPGGITSVSAVANATGGIRPGGLIERDN